MQRLIVPIKVSELIPNEKVLDISSFLQTFTSLHVPPLKTHVSKLPEALIKEQRTSFFLSSLGIFVIAIFKVYLLLPLIPPLGHKTDTLISPTDKKSLLNDNSPNRVPPFILIGNMKIRQSIVFST